MTIGLENFTNKSFYKHLDTFIELAQTGKGDSDRHQLVLFSIALASKGKTYIELGVREGVTTLPLLTAAQLNEGKLISVDINSSSFVCPEELKDAVYKFRYH